MADLILKRGKEKSLIRRHPWIFSGSIAIIIGTSIPESIISTLNGYEWINCDYYDTMWSH